MGDLIWAGVTLAVSMTAVLGLLGPARKAITQWGDAHGLTAAERDAAAVRALAEAERERHELTVRHGALAEETAREKARLAMETAQFEADAEAARRSLDAAVKARMQVLQARADAEAALAPEAARKALEGSDGEVMAALADAYAAYCREHEGAFPYTFGRWIQGFQGVRGA